MVSSLAAQLQQLREGGAGSKRKTDSFLYDTREAAQIDDETVYNLAWNGLLELKQLDASFDAFDPSRDAAKLFSRQRIHFHRVQITKAEDTELTVALAKLLDALSPYFLLGAAHKVLEFLVRRYEIQRYNVEDVMATIISYHESKWFAKMVKLLHIHNTKWEFLLQVKQTEEPLLRQALVQRSIDEHSVVEFIFTSATRIGASNPKLISLYALVVLQMLDQTAVNEQMLRWLIPDLLLALKTKQFPEMQAAAYMIVTKLSSKAVLSDKVVETLVKHLVKYAQKIGGGAQLNALLCVIYVAETQPSFALSPSVGKYLVATDNLVDFLAEAAHNYESATFVSSFVHYLIDTMLDANEDDVSYQLIVDIVARVGVVEYIVSDLVETLHTVASEAAYDLEQTRVKAASGVLVAISKKFVNKADESVQSLTATTMESATKQTKKKFNAFLEHTFGQIANSALFVPANTDAKTSLALALDHPTENTRFTALQTLMKQHDDAQANGSSERVLTSPGVLLRRLHDDSARIVKLVASSSLGDLLLQLCSKKKALDVIAQVVHKWAMVGKVQESGVVVALVELLVGKFRDVFGSEFDEKLLVLVLSLVPLVMSAPSPSLKKKQKDKLASAVSKLSVEQMWNWVSRLEHPFAKSLEGAAGDHTVMAMATRFGHVLAEKDVSKFLPFCLSWSTPSDVNPLALTSFLIPVLSSARTEIHNHKKARSKTHKENVVALDQALRFVLKKEFVRLSQDASATEKESTSIVEIAQLLSLVAVDTFAVDVQEFDACVFTLLQAPAQVFVQVQDAFVQIFQSEASGLEHQLLPTMGRAIVKAYSGSENVDLMTVLAKVRALDIIGAALEGDDEEDVEEVEQVLPVVIVALGDANVRVRETALGFLEGWVAGVSSGSSRSEVIRTFASVSSFLLKARGDILMDARAVATLCGTYQRDNGAVFAGVIVRVASKASDAELVLSVKLLELLAEVQDAHVWEKTIPFTERLLASLSPEDSLSSKQLKNSVLKVLVAHFVSAEETSKKKPSKNAFFELVMAVLHDQDKQRLPLLTELQAFTLAHLRPAYFDLLDVVAQHALVARLLRLLMVADESVASQLIRCVSELPLTAAMFVRLLSDELANKSAPPTALMVATRRVSAAEEKETEFFQELSCILEVLAIKVDDIASEDGASELLKVLTETLALLCRPENTDRVSEYTLQIVFGCLRRVCEVHAIGSGVVSITSVSKSGKASKAADLEPEHLVKHTLVCLGRTSSPTTRNEALLFISALVNVYPASVLKSLDKILSFLASGAIHQDDEYSFNVLETIVKSVVPHILQDAASSITPQQFIRIFVDAYDQIPLKRRALLFQVLVQSLGRNFLPYAVVAIVQNGVIASQLEDRVQFAHQLSFEFDAVTQIAALVTQLRFLKDLHTHVIDDSDTDTDGMGDDDDDEDDEKLDESARFQWDASITTSPSLARKLNLAIATFIPSHLQARDLHHQILRLEEEEDDEAMDDDDDEDDETSSANKLQQHYLVLAQVVLLYFRRVAREQTVQDDGSDAEVATRGFWGELGQQTIEILGALQQLLSTPGFVAVISELLHHDNALVRKKAMQLFNERLQDDRSSLTPGEEMLFVDMVEELDTILRNEENAESSVNIQTALLSVDILARNFAAQHTKRFQAVLPTMIKYVSLDLSSTTTSASPMALHLMGCAYVSLSSVCRAVGPLVFPFLPKFFPNLLAAIEFCTQKSKKTTDASTVTSSAGSPIGGVKTVLQCLLAALEVFTDHIPQFLTPYLSKIVHVLLLTSSGSSRQIVSASSSLLLQHQHQQISVDACFLNLTNHVELRHLLPSLFGGYEFALSQEDAGVEKLFSVVSAVVSSLDTAHLRQYLAQFARFFVTSLDLRRVHAHKLEDLDAVEDEALEVLVQFILRLNEKQLKPLFLKIAEWAQHVKTPQGESARRIVFFKLLSKLSERLKSIFVPYYAHVLELLTRSLRETRDALATKKPKVDAANASETEGDDEDDDDFFARDEDDDTKSAAAAGPSRKKRKLVNGASAEDGVVSRANQLLQLQIAVRALNGCFVHDSDGFMDKDKFDVVMTPLVDSIDILKYVPEAKPFVFDHVSECVANLAWAAKNDLLWKPLHYAVLMKSRGDSAAVRLATLKIVDKCYTVIGDEFLAMLPESIPFLAELMEDNDAEVEKTCHQVIKQIEEISGESLDQYLTA